MCRLILSAESKKGIIVYKGSDVLTPFWFSTNDLLYDMDACVGPLLILSAESQKGIIVYNGYGVLTPFWFSTND